MNGRLRRLKWILSPSLVSGLSALFLACLIWGSAGWSYITDTQLFYDQLFGAYGTVTIIQVQPYNLGAMQNTILNGPLTYYVLLLAVSLIAGISIYIILESINRVVHGASLFFREVHADRQSARDAAKESLVRLGLRIAGLLAWALYWLIFANVLLPFSILVLQQTLENISDGSWTSWVMLLPTFAALIAAIHLHVTFARLVFLRVRLFGGFDAELSRIESEHD